MGRQALLIAVTLSLGVGLQSWAQPSLSHSSPGAVQPGQTLELTLHGTKLDDPLQVWTSFPATVEIQPGPADAKDQKSRVCKVTVGADVAVGIGGMMLGSPAGLSDIALVMIDDLASVADNGKNHSLAQAQTIPVPVAVDGIANGTSFDHYKFAGKKDQRLSVEVVSARLGISFDAVVRLLKADGTEIMLADDDDGVGADARLSLTLPEDGEYVLEVRDNQFRSGGRYRLRVGDFPLVTVPYPLGGRLGSTAQFQFAGPATDGSAPLLLRIPDEVSTGRVSVAARFPDGKSSGLATIVASPLPEAREAEPNDALKVATPVTIPAAINGSLKAAGDRDYFTFAAMKDQTLTFNAISRSLGSPSLIFMRLYNGDGNQLAETAVNDNDEWALTHKFPADGMYWLMVEDLLHRGGPEHAYRVEVNPHDGYSLAIKNDKDTRLQFNPPSNGGAQALTVQVNRSGYDGAIELALQDAADGYQLLNPTVPAKAKEHRLILAVPEGAGPGDLRTLRLVGHATVDGRPRSVVVETVPTLRAKRPQLPFPPAWMDGLISFTVANEFDAFFGTKFEPAVAPFQKESGQAQCAFTLERKHKDFKDGVTVMVEHLPPGFSSSVKADKDKYDITITGPKDAADATHTFQVVSYGEFQGKGMLVKQDLSLEIKTAEVKEAAEK